MHDIDIVYVSYGRRFVFRRGDNVINGYVTGATCWISTDFYISDIDDNIS